MKLLVAAILFVFAASNVSACPYKRLTEIKDAIYFAQGCQSAVALYERCGAQASSFNHLTVLADAARGRCERVFYGKIHQREMRGYKSMRMFCDKKLKAMQGVAPASSPRMLCGPYAAYEYARAFTVMKDKLRANPDPKL